MYLDDSIVAVEYSVGQNPTIFHIVLHLAVLTLLIRIPTAVCVVDLDLAY